MHSNTGDSIKVEILSTKLIMPSSPTPPHLQCYKLSFFDQISNREHVPTVLFYPHCSNSISDVEMEERLEKSLSNILTHASPLAGRYAEDELSILCLDQGVSYTRAKVNRKLDDFIKETSKDLGLSVLFWPHDSKDVDMDSIMTIPIVTVQITKFECGGLAVVISSSHPAMDGFSGLTFSYEWANACRLGTPADKINFFSFNTGDVFPATDLSRLFKPPIPQEGNKQLKFVSKRFVIKEAAILRLKKQLASLTGSEALTFEPTRVEIIAAVIWSVLIRTSEAVNGYLRPSLMGFPLNFRSKISRPEIVNSMGNLVIDVPMKFVPGKTKMELHHLIILIRTAVKKIVASCAEASPEEIVSIVADLYNSSFQAPEWGGNAEVDKFTCTSLCWFPIIDADFGWGKPSLMFFGLKDINMAWLHDTDCRTGVGLQMDLSERYMNLFESNLDIKALTQF